MQKNIEDKLKELRNKARFISCVISGEIKIAMRTGEELLQDIIARGFDRLPKEGKTIGVNGDIKSNPDATDYAYLTNIYVCCLNEEYLGILVAQLKRTEAELSRKDTPSLLHAAYKNAESDREVMTDRGAKDSEVFDAAPRSQHNRTETKAFKKKLRAHKGINKRAKESSNTGVLIAHPKNAKQSELIGAHWQWRKL